MSKTVPGVSTARDRHGAGRVLAFTLLLAFAAGHALAQPAEREEGQPAPDRVDQHEVPPPPPVYAPPDYVPPVTYSYTPDYDESPEERSDREATGMWLGFGIIAALGFGVHRACRRLARPLQPARTEPPALGFKRP